MKSFTLLLALAILLFGLSVNAFGWGYATHVYFAHQLGLKAGAGNFNEMYGAVLTDAFNLNLSPAGQYMANQLHFHAMKFVKAANSCDLQAVAFGLASHNGKWAADSTAHATMLTYDPALGVPNIGYAKIMGQLMTPQLQPKLYAIMAGQGVPDEIAVPLSWGLAPEFGHDLSETAVDILVKMAVDPGIGDRIKKAAMNRPSAVGTLLAETYAEGLAEAVGISFQEAYSFIVEGEKAHRATIVQYGALFTRNENKMLQALAYTNARIASEYITTYVQSYGFPGTVSVAPEEAGLFIEAAIGLVQPGFGPEIALTLAMVEKKLEKHEVVTCPAPPALAREGIEDVTGSLPKDFALEGNYPNPFNPTTSIAFRLPVEGTLTLEIFNILGQKVRTLLNGQVYGAGSWSVMWNGRDDAGQVVPTGTYISRLSSGARTMTRKMMMAK